MCMPLCYNIFILTSFVMQIKYSSQLFISLKKNQNKNKIEKNAMRIGASDEKKKESFRFKSNATKCTSTSSNHLSFEILSFYESRGILNFHINIHSRFENITKRKDNCKQKFAWRDNSF